jgi:outer membrane protein assembly factor BamB
MRCRLFPIAALAAFLACTTCSFAQDWPQWRGLNRDGKVAGFRPPASWPKELTKKWQVTVGDGVATPALVGDKLYVFARQDGEEVLRCFEAATGKELWEDQEKYKASAPTGGASGFPGPRSSPTVANGKVVTLGASGILSCLDAASGKLLWRNNDFRDVVPMFFTSSSPLVVDNLCVAQLGGDRRGGGIFAFDLDSGKEKWKWTEDGTAYGSPVLMTIGDTKAVVAATAGNLVALNAADGAPLWQVRYSQGRYNAATPIPVDQTLIYAGPGPGITSESLGKDGDSLVAKELWHNGDNSVMFNTPVVRDGLVFGLSNTNNLFCLNAESGKTNWAAPLTASSGTPQQGEAAPRPEGGQRAEGGQGQRPDAQRPGGGRGFGGRGFGGGRGGYGSVVDAGAAMFALSPAGQLVVFEPSGEEFKQLASYKVADGNTYAYPILTNKGVYIKDKDAVTLWAFE